MQPAKSAGTWRQQPACGVSGGVAPVREDQRSSLWDAQSGEEPQRVPVASYRIHFIEENERFQRTRSLSWRGKIASGNKSVSHFKLSGSRGS